MKTLGPRHFSLWGIVWVLVWAAAQAPAQTPPAFQSIAIGPDRAGNLSLATTVNAYYRLDVSTNLVDWHSWRTVQGTGQEMLLDTGAAFLPERYYRARQLEGSAHLTGDHLPTASGDLLIHPIRHASFLMTWNGLNIYNDPDSPTSLYSGLPKADVILISHDHGDHYDTSALDSLHHAATRIVAPQAVFDRMNATLRALTTVLDNGETLDLLGLHVRAVPAYNSYHQNGEGNGYVTTLGGRQVYTSSDTGDVAEMRALTGIDVAFVAMNQPFTMSVNQAASAVREFQPRIVYPYHYRNSDGSLADLQGFQSLVQAEPRVYVEVRLRSSWY